MPWHNLGRLLLGLPWLIVAGGVPAAALDRQELARGQEVVDALVIGEGAGDPAPGDRASGGLLVLGSLLRTYALKPGDEVEAEILVQNVSAETQIARLYPTDYRRTEAGTLSFPEAGSLPRSNSRWVVGIPQEHVIPAGATVPVSFLVRVPADLSDMGTYWSVIMVQGFPLDDREAPAEMGRVMVREAFRTAVRVVTEVSTPGVPVVTSLRFADRALVMGENGAELHLAIENDGPSILRLSLWAEVLDLSGRVVGRLPAPGLALLPGEVGLRRMDLAELSPGRYEVLVVADGQGQDVFGARYQVEIPEKATTAWGRHLRIARADDGVVRSVPGDVVTLALQVENLSRVAHTLTESLELPPGWRSVVPPGSFRLEPAERSLRLVVVQPGARAPGGVHDLRYHLMSESDPNVGGGLRTRTEVAEVQAVELVLLDPKPPPILAGESASLGLQVLNLGNVPMGVRLSAQSTSGTAVQLLPDTLSLAAGEEVTVQVTVVTDRQSTGRVLPVTVLASTPDAMEGRPVQATLRISMDVIPGGASEGGWIVYPMAVSTQHSWDAGLVQTRTSVHGSGFLDGNEARRVQFLLSATDHGRSPGWPTTVRQAWGSFALPWGQVMMGDRSVQLTDLIASGRSGRGVAVELAPTRLPLRLTGYRLSRGVLDGRRTDLGGSAAFGPWSWSGSGVRTGAGPRVSSVPAMSFRIHALETMGHPQGVRSDGRERLLALEGQFMAGTGAILQGEYARGPGGTGWRLDAYGRWSASGSYRVRVWEDHGLSSGDAGAVMYDGHLNLPLPGGFRGSFATRYAARSARLPEVTLLSRRDLRHRGRLRRDLWPGASGTLEVERWGRADHATSTRRIVQQQHVRLGITQTLGSLSYRGELEDRGDGAPGYRLSLNYRPERTLSARVEIHRRPRSPAREDSWVVDWHPSPSLRLQGSYTRTGNPFLLGITPDGVRSSQIGLSLAMAMDPDQALRVDLQRRSTPFGGDQGGVQLSYERRLAVPVARRRGFGRWEGVVRLKGMEGETPLPDALVRVAGVAQRTDQNGRFRFRALPEGEHLVRIEAPSPIQGGMLVQPAGARVVIGGEGQTERTDLTLYEGGSLRGALIVAEMERAPEVAPLGPAHALPPSLAGIRIELSQGDVIRRTWTDADGRFLFQPLRPGIWSLRVDATGMPPLTRLEQEVLEVVVAPGSVSEVHVFLVRVERRLRIVDEGPVSGAPEE